MPAKKINCLLALENQELWIGTDRGVARWNGKEVTQTGVPSLLKHVRILAMIRDRDSNIWLGTDAGLLRYNSNGVSTEERPLQSHAGVAALLEDREGNLWTGGATGVERLRDSAFVTYTTVDGLPSDRNGPVYVDAEGRTWFTPLEGGLYWLKDGKSRSVTEAGLARDVVYSISGRDHELWIGRQRGGLTVLSDNGRSFTSKTYTQAEGLAQNSVYAVIRVVMERCGRGLLVGE